MSKTTKIPCDKCGKSNADSVHIVLRQVSLCDTCASSTQDSEVPDCEDCGLSILECSCEEYSRQDLQDDLNDVHDLTMCLFILLHTKHYRNLPGLPHLTLVNQIGRNVSQITKNIRENNE